MLRSICRRFATVMLVSVAVGVGSGVQAGEWIKVATVEDTDFYLDLDAVLQQGDIVSLRQLRDCGTQQTFMGSMYGFSWRSAILDIDYNCSARQRRQIKGAWFAENMAQGRRTFSKNHPEDWTPIEESGLNDALWKNACGR